MTAIIRKLLPFGVSLILVVMIVRLAPWDEVWRTLQNLQADTVLLLLMLSMLYYLTKIIRFWLMLKILKIKEPLGITAIVYLAAQPISLLPGGELYRAKALQTYRGVPMAKATPTFTAQGLFEGLAIAVAGLLSAIALDIEQVPVVILAVLVAMGIFGIRRGYLEPVLKFLNRHIPFLHVSSTRLRRFSRQNQDLLRSRQLLRLGTLSLATELIGAAIAYVSVVGVGGQIGPLEAVLLYIIPLVVAFVSLLPGGFGASEQSGIGLLLLLGQSGGVAVAATLVMRTAIVIMGLVYGALALAALKLYPQLRRSAQ
jgi:uncharacterized protein (TIRG00374 family)